MIEFKLSTADRKFLLEAARNGGRQRGFECYRRRGLPLMAYHCKKLGVVVKHPKFILDPRTPLCVRVPTIRLDKYWVAQPVVEKRDLWMAVAIIERRMKPYRKYGIHPDIHTQNVGWWRGVRPVLFDW